MRDPKAIRKAIMTAKSIAAMVDPHFARVPLPDLGEPAPEMVMPEPQQFAVGGVTAGRSPELQSYAQNIGTPDFDQERYNSLIDRHKPVRPYDSIPTPATKEDMLRGLAANKHHKINAVDSYQEGHPVGLRLDIPAYTKHQVWVPTMHDLLQGGKPFSHQGAAHITDATFDMSESQASAVAKGRAKSPFAHIDGHLKKTSVDDIHEMAKAALDSPEWVQVGMDPERHSYFYDRSNHRRPIRRADEVLQVGPLVLAKNPVFGDPDDHAYEYGGRVGYADGGMPDDDRGRSPVIMVHGGSDFEDIDPSKYGTGESGGIRPLGNGLYGFVLHSGNMDEAPRAVDFARHYATKYGRGEKAIHAFRLDLEGADTGFNGPEIEGLRGKGGAERQRLEEAYEQRNKFPSGSTEWWNATDEVRAAERALQKSQAVRFERLPVGLTEAAVHTPHRLKRIGKIDLDQPDSDLLDIIHKEMGAKRKQYANGGMPDDEGVDRQANLSAFLEGNHPLVPSVVYHGTDRNISEFDTEKPRRIDAGINPDYTDTGWYGKGHYFTPHKNAANNFASGYRVEEGGGPNVMPVHLSLKNPFIVKFPRSSSGGEAMDQAMNAAGFPQTSDERLIRKGRGERLPSEQTKMLMDAGHDGVIVMHQYGIKDPEEERAAEQREQAAWERHQAAKNAFYDAPFENANNQAEVKAIKDEFINSRREYHAAKDAAGGEYHPHELVVFRPHQVKSAIGNSGRYDPNEAHIGRATGGEVDQPTDYTVPDNLGLYSHAAATAASLPQAKASPAEFRSMLANKGVKKAEFEASGYDQAFAPVAGANRVEPITREQVAAHFHQNRTPIVEKSFREEPPKEEEDAFNATYAQPYYAARDRIGQAIEEGRRAGTNPFVNPTEEFINLQRDFEKRGEAFRKNRGLLSNKYKRPYHESYMLPGGENYREVLLKHGSDDTLFGGVNAHFKGEPNILAHLLMKDRTDTEGKNVLHLDELQSDWAQQGRKEGFRQPVDEDRFHFLNSMYADERTPAEQAEYSAIREKMKGVSSAPYIKNTDDWVNLGLKRALMEAAKGGHDKLAWTPGQTAADRYRLSKYVSAIHHNKNEDGTYNIRAIGNNGERVYGDNKLSEKKLEETFGKEIASKIASGEGVGREEAEAKVEAARKAYQDFRNKMVETQFNNWRQSRPDFLNSEEDAQTARRMLRNKMEEDSYTFANMLGVVDEHESLRGNLIDARQLMNQLPRGPMVEDVGGSQPSRNWRALSGLDLQVGGEGMKKFYDEIVPKRLMELAKKHDPEAKFSTATVKHPVSQNDYDQGDTQTDLQALEITPRMRESILKKGFPAYASGGEVEGYADGGDVGGYQDPETRHISDWKWRPVGDVQESLGNLKEIPSHVEKFGDFMDNISKRAGGSGLTARDLIKAYTITRSSIQRQAADVNKLRASGLALPEEMTGKIRPEGAFGEWLHTPAGQAYLDAAERGKVHQTAIQNAIQVMAPFGRHQTDIPDALTWAALNLPGKEKQVSELVHAARLMASTPEDWRAFTQNIRGVGPSKSGFLASLMGRGDQPTLDARQIILHTGRPTSEAAKYIAKKGGAGSVEAVNRLAARQNAMDLSLPDRLRPYYQHLAHHTVWDKAGDDETTHEDVVRAMHHAANGGFQTADDDPSVLIHPVAQTILAAAHGGDALNNELFQKYLKRIHSPLSGDPDSIRKALEIAESYRHKTGTETGTGSFYSIKQSMPASSVTRTIGNIPGVNLKPKKQGTWEDFYNIAKDAEFVNVGGDLSGFGRLTHINGKPLSWPVDLHAGADYMREPNPKRVWANIQAHSTSYKNKILDSQERGKDLYGIFSPMGPSAVNSSHNMLDTLMAQIPNAEIAPEHIKEFDEAIKRGDHLASIKKKNPDIFNEYVENLKKWPGLEKAKEVSDFARPETGNINGGHRAKIVEFMDKSYWRDRGFPEVGVTRAAITNPDLLGAGGNKLGFRAVKLSANEPAGSKRIFKHSTYPVDTFGEYVMDLPLVQRHYAQPDVIDRLIMNPAKGGQVVHPYSEDPMGRNTARKLFEEQKQVQPVNQRFLDSVMTGMENQQKYGFKKGGKVRSALMIAKGLKKS